MTESNIPPETDHSTSPATATERVAEADVVEALRQIFDPEIPVNIYDLGLIYDISVVDQTKVTVKMTLTSPNCPVAESLPQEVRDRVAAVERVSDAEIDIVWDPPWNPSMMSEAARLELGMV